MKYLSRVFSFAVAGALCVTGTLAVASVQTRTSPVNGGTLLAPAVSEVGGLVFHAKGLNGTILTSQMAASSLYEGFAGANPQVIGTQNGFTTAILDQLGGGFAEFAIRVTLFDGDTGVGDFDNGQNYLLVNGVGSLGSSNFSSVTTQQTTAVGANVGGPSTGFRDNRLDTGFFHYTNAGQLATVFNNLYATGQLVVSLFDTDAGDNFYDFTQGIDTSLIDVGTPPAVNPVPEPGSVLVWSVAALGMACSIRRRQRS